MKCVVCRRQFSNPVKPSYGRGSVSKTLPKDLCLEKQGLGKIRHLMEQVVDQRKEAEIFYWKGKGRRKKDCNQQFFQLDQERELTQILIECIRIALARNFSFSDSLLVSLF